LLDFEAKTRFADGLRDTIAWHRERRLEAEAAPRALAR
jgi:hypothetical protein